MLGLPMAGEPGASFTYNSGATMLLSGVLKKATGRTAEGYGGQFIFVIPALDMVVVSTATNFDATTDIRALLNAFVFPAMD